MTILDILYTILIGPLQLVFEIIYTIANRFIGHPGLSIIVLSLVMNFLVLPLYKRSDAMQEEARDIDAKLKNGVEHIKKTFHGDERMMIMQTYYRQNNYKPTDALNGSVSLLLQVPFFMAAYNFLSNLGEIQNVSLGPIKNLGVPDAMYTVAGFDINVLPIIMTLVNIISSAIYLKGFPLKQKIQIYGMALFFLVFLYTSPAGLVFYWTLNNVFSLVKTIFYKLKNPKKENAEKKERQFQNDKKLFVLGALFLTILVGVVIPSALIAASPLEFVDVTFYHNPIWYVVYALCLSAGTFLVWFGVFYWIASPAGKAIMNKIIWLMCGVMIVNYMFFGTDLGTISENLSFESGLKFSVIQILQNLLVVVAVAAIMYFISSKFPKLTGMVLLTGVIALGGMSGVNIVRIQDATKMVEIQAKEVMDSTPRFNLSKNGKNVVVIMLDRAMGQYIPYIMNEKPELKEKFEGFTHYSNVISFGGYTNFGTPALFGGYEYTPVEMNLRKDETLASKQNEALKVMPVLFSNNGYDVTVCDPPYANYQLFTDLSIYDKYPEINTYVTDGKYDSVKTKEYQIQSNRRNFFCYSIMKTMPLFAQTTIYQGGNYNQARGVLNSTVYSNQVIHNKTSATGVNNVFMSAYNVLLNLNNVSKIVDDESNNFMVMTNNSAHEPALLQLPDYEPEEIVDNSAYEMNDEVYTVDGVTLKMETSYQITHYHANMAAILQLGNWFDYLRENGVYDNTRIILVGDHGRSVYQIDELLYEDLIYDDGKVADLALYFPLLMVKDFNSEGFVISDEFMTNADVATLAVQDLIENPVNPFTGKELNNNEKYAHEQYVTISKKWNTDVNNGNVFLPGQWFAVSEDIWDLDNWRLIDEQTSIPSELVK